jgi:predicted extracellular nuclease
MRHFLSKALVAVAAIAAPVVAQAEVRITEFMYQGANSGNREFFELTNISDTAIDITNWYFDDDSRNPTVAFGSLFGVLGAHESIIVTELSAAAFRTYWGLDASVRIFGNNTVTFGASDELNIYSSSSSLDLVDRVFFSGNTRGISRNRPGNETGQLLNSAFLNSSVGDAYGSTFSPGTPADLGNPGRFPFTPAAPIPEPASWAMMILGMGVAGASLRHRKTAVRFA